MDVRRHVTAGRLSELFGEDTLETDEFVRTMGWRRVAEQELALLEARDPRRARGVRRRASTPTSRTAARRRSPCEYTVLGAGGLDYRPEPWTPVDSLAWLKAMAWDLRGNMDDEIDRVLALRRPHAGAGRRAVPGVPLRASTRRSSARARSSTGSSSRTPTEGGTRNPERPAFTADQRGPAAPAAPHARAAAGARRPRRRHRQQQLGGRRRALRRPASRCWPTTRTSASACRASGCRWACTADGRAATARSTSRASPSPACPA